MKRFSKVYVEIINVCNLKCSFCLPSKIKPRIMNIDEFKKVAKEVISLTDLITLHIKGEPLMHPELGEILKICEEIGLKVNITTNGTLLLNNIDILKSKAVRQLNISLHSINENDNLNMDYKKYMNNIFMVVRTLKDFSNPYISYRLWNLKTLNENSENYEIINLLEKEYKISNLVNLAKENSYIELEDKVFLNQDIEFKWPSLDDEIISDIGKCYGLRNQIGILANGDVVPCCLDQNGDIKLGNIFEESLEEILSSDLAKKIIKGFENNKLIPELCRRCTFINKFNN